MQDPSFNPFPNLWNPLSSVENLVASAGQMLNTPNTIQQQYQFINFGSDTTSLNSSSDASRRRVLSACERCIKRHIKCDGQSPCSNCDSLDLCVYAAKRKRGPKPKKNSDKKLVTQPPEQVVSLVNGSDPFKDIHFVKTSTLEQYTTSPVVAEFIRHIQPIYYAIDVPTSADVRFSEEKRFLFCNLMANALMVSKKIGEAQAFAKEAEIMLATSLSGKSGLDIGNGLLLLSYYEAANGLMDKANIHSAIAYQVATMLQRRETQPISGSRDQLALDQSTKKNSLKFSFLMMKTLSSMIYSAHDDEDVLFYWNKSKRYCASFLDRFTADMYFVKKIENPQIALQMIDQLEAMNIKERKRVAGRNYQTVTMEGTELFHPLWVYDVQTVILAGCRSLIYWKCDNSQLARLWARTAVDSYLSVKSQHGVYFKGYFASFENCAKIAMYYNDIPLLKYIYPVLQEYTEVSLSTRDVAEKVMAMINAAGGSGGNIFGNLSTPLTNKPSPLQEFRIEAGKGLAPYLVSQNNHRGQIPEEEAQDNINGYNNNNNSNIHTIMNAFSTNGNDQINHQVIVGSGDDSAASVSSPSSEASPYSTSSLDGPSSSQLSYFPSYNEISDDIDPSLLISALSSGSEDLEAFLGNPQ